MPTHSEVFLTLRSVTACFLSSNILLHLQDAPITQTALRNSSTVFMLKFYHYRQIIKENHHSPTTPQTTKQAMIFFHFYISSLHRADASKGVIKNIKLSSQKSSKEKAIHSRKSRVTFLGTRSWVLVLGF